MKQRNRYIFIVLYSVIVTGCAGFVSVVLIQSLGSLVRSLREQLGLGWSTTEQVAEALSALKHAEFRLPVLMMLILTLLAGYWIVRLKRIASKTAAAVMASLLTVCLTIWFTEVNAIRFGDVVQSLMGLVMEGIF